jgi:hypothetical protein
VKVQKLKFGSRPETGQVAGGRNVQKLKFGLDQKLGSGAGQQIFKF